MIVESYKKIKRHRIFIAINLPQEIKNDLLKSIQDFYWLPVRWVKKENIHLTLAFLGYLTDDEILKVIEGVNELKNSSPFYLEINQISYAPERKNPSMIWAKVKKTKELIDLKDRLDRILNKSIGFVPEGHFLPHLTLGRIKKWDFRKIEPEDRPEIENEVSFKFLVNSIEIMESNLKKGGAEYFVVKSIPFSK